MPANCNFCGETLGYATDEGLYSVGVKGVFSIPSIIYDEHYELCPVLKEWKRCKE
jgi:hypothetical protein